jgi:hypothetical protein
MGSKDRWSTFGSDEGMENMGDENPPCSFFAKIKYQKLPFGTK